MKTASPIFPAIIIVVIIASLAATPLIDIARKYILAISIVGVVLFYEQTRNRCRVLITDLFGDNQNEG